MAERTNRAIGKLQLLNDHKLRERDRVVRLYLICLSSMFARRVDISSHFIFKSANIFANPDSK